MSFFLFFLTEFFFYLSTFFEQLHFNGPVYSFLWAVIFFCFFCFVYSFIIICVSFPWKHPYNFLPCFLFFLFYSFPWLCMFFLATLYSLCYSSPPRCYHFLFSVIPRFITVFTLSFWIFHACSISASFFFNALFLLFAASISRNWLHLHNFLLLFFCPSLRNSILS